MTLAFGPNTASDMSPSITHPGPTTLSLRLQFVIVQLSYTIEFSIDEFVTVEPPLMYELGPTDEFRIRVL